MAGAVKEKRAYKGSLRQEQAQMTRHRILEAARRLLVSGTYGDVTMHEIAAEAGVAYQTVYSIFGTKLKLAHAIIEAGWPHIDDALNLVAQVRASSEPEIWLRTAARISRLIYGPCADLNRFARESGDPDLLARYRQGEEQRFAQMSELAEMLARGGRLRSGTSALEAHAVLWTMTGSDLYTQLVFQRSWKAARYEEWLGEALISLLLQPQPARTPG